MDFRDLSYIRVPSQNGYKDCYKIVDVDTNDVIWWSPVTVTFEHVVENGVKRTDISSLYYGQDVELPETGSFGGYWYSGTLPEAYNPITCDTTISILYSSCRYNIAYQTGGHGEIPTKTTYVHGEEYAPSALTEHGYVFLGWNPEKIEPTTTGDIEFKANWEELPVYKVTFIDNGTAIHTVDVISGDTIADLPTVTKAGYTPSGWFYDQNWEKPYESESMVSNDTSLYVKWQPNVYNVTFETNGGTIDWS